MRAVGILAALAAGAAIANILPVATEGLPLTWTHQLNAQCSWDRRPWFTVLPTKARAHLRVRVGNLPNEVRDEVVACYVRRGLTNPEPSVNVIMRKWPSDAEFTAWRAEPWKP